MDNIKIYRWVCSCGKEIKSFYPREFEYNKKAHMQIHKLPAKKKKTIEVQNATA